MFAGSRRLVRLGRCPLKAVTPVQIRSGLLPARLLLRRPVLRGTGEWPGWVWAAVALLVGAARLSSGSSDASSILVGGTEFGV